MARKAKRTPGASIEISGDGTEAKVTCGRDVDLAALAERPGVREVWLDRCELTPAMLRPLLGLADLEALLLDDSPVGEAGLEVLDGLPPGTMVKFSSRRRRPDPAQNAFRRRRVASAARLGPERRREAAERFLRGAERLYVLDRQPSRRALYFGEHCQLIDDELRYLSWASEIEELTLASESLDSLESPTSDGLRYLSGMPGLRSLIISLPFNSTLEALADLPSLEKLDIYPTSWPEGDRHTAGLERLTGLRTLVTRGAEGPEFGDETLRRIGALTRLERLKLHLGGLEDEEGLSALAGLAELQELELSPIGRFSDECLRHFAGLSRLRSLSLSIDVGDGSGLRHLAGLTSLRYLEVTGEAVTDPGIFHLAGLAGLRILQVAGTRVSRAGAARLAEALPQLTVHGGRRTGGGWVVKSPRRPVRLRRRLLGEFASALLPEDWTVEDGDAGLMEADAMIEAMEDGFDLEKDPGPNDSTGEGEPASIRMWAGKAPDVADARAYLKRCAVGDYGYRPRKIAAVDLGPDAGPDAAAGEYLGEEGRYLAGVILKGGWGAGVAGRAPRGRFKEFRKLFAIVAGSIRVGPEARVDVGEIVEVPASELG